MIRKYSIWMFVAGVVLIPMCVFAIVKWYETGYTPLPVLGPKGHTVSNFSLMNQYGATASLNDWENKIVVANVFFTHCPVVCPKMTRNLRTVQRVFTNNKNLLIASFSVDPERDSVPQLQTYASRMDIQKGWQLITGSKKEIYRLARKSLLLVATDGDGGEDDFIHSEMLVLIDPQKRIRGFYKGTDEKAIKELLQDIQRLQKEYKTN